MDQLPAILGGKPSAKEKIPYTRPPLDNRVEKILPLLKEILDSKMITSSKYVKELERKVAEFIGVKHCITTNSCTSALYLALKAKIKEGEVILPSFTFPATAHGVSLAGLKIKLVDCKRDTFNIDIEDLKEKISSKTKLILPVHVFGNPCDHDSLREIADDYHIPLFYDAAHGFGGSYNNQKIGSLGDCEVFSGSPTKAFTTVEGGLLLTNSDEIADYATIGKNYGHRGDYFCEFPGLSARMSELHAVVGLSIIDDVPDEVLKRNSIANYYLENLSDIPGITFQTITKNSVTTYKDFGFLVDPEEFGLGRDEACIALEEEGIAVKKYFYPPIHKQPTYPELHNLSENLPNTNYIANNILCIPVFTGMDETQMKQIVTAIHKVQKHSKEIKVKLNA
ncbi:MAG: DegT/DnrJ/EryC1/StrS family aminotransferase [Candidatus Ranarchaeia archaeon]